MHRSQSSKSQTAKRIGIFLLMCVSVAGLLFILVLYMLGYRFNRADGQVEQGALVQFESRPSGATVNIDEMVPGSRTPSKITVSTGSHFITMRKDGYRQWQKSISVTSGQLLWLNYARLIPETLTPKTIGSFQTVSSAAASQDQKWVVLATDAIQPTLRLMDISGDEVKQSDFALPATTYTAPSEGKTQQFSVVDWAQDNQHFLVKHIYDDDKIEWLLASRNDAGSTKNLSAALGIQASRMVFSTNDANVLYAQTGTEVRRVNSGNLTLSGPLITNVATFDVHVDNTLAYVTAKSDTQPAQSVGYYKEGAKGPHPIRTLPNNTPDANIAIGRYFNESYVAIAYGSTLEIMTGDLPTDINQTATLKSVATLTVDGTIGDLSIHNHKTDGRFIAVQHGSSLTTYDLELKKSSVTALAGTSTPQWVDMTHFVDTTSGMATLFDFDGANKQELMKVQPGLTTTLSQNGKYFYGFALSDDGTTQFRRVQLIQD